MFAAICIAVIVFFAVIVFLGILVLGYIVFAGCFVFPIRSEPFPLDFQGVYLLEIGAVITCCLTSYHARLFWQR